MQRARIAAVILGFLGGGFGLILALATIAFGYESILRNEPNGVLVTLFAAAGVPLSVIAMMAAYIARERARIAFPVLLAAAVLGFLTTALWFVPGLLLLVAGGLAFYVRRTDYVPPKDA